MRAQNLSICVPNNGCDKGCPYCVSTMTGYVKSDITLMDRNKLKVLKIIENSGISTVLFTGKGEPILNFGFIEHFAGDFKDYILEIQTNGLLLAKNYDYCNSTDKGREYTYVYKLYKLGFNTIAFSIDEENSFIEYEKVFKMINNLGMNIRITLNISDDLNYLTFREIIGVCLKYNIKQLSLRQLTIPNNKKENSYSNNSAEWIKDHTQKNVYDRLIDEFLKEEKFLIRTLPFGAKVYDIYGISFTYFDYCVQDDHTLEDIRTLIYQEDGHLYTNWNSKASILF